MAWISSVGVDIGHHQTLHHLPIEAVPVTTLPLTDRHHAVTVALCGGCASLTTYIRILFEEMCGPLHLEKSVPILACVCLLPYL